MYDEVDPFFIQEADDELTAPEEVEEDDLEDEAEEEIEPLEPKDS